MLRLSVENEEYLMVGDNVKIIFLGGTGNHHRIMIDAPKEVKIVRSKTKSLQLNFQHITRKKNILKSTGKKQNINTKTKVTEIINSWT